LSTNFVNGAGSRL